MGKSVCIVPGCDRRKDKYPDIAYHAFPYQNQSLCSKWLSQAGIKLELASIPRWKCICSAHFDAECYKRDLMNELLGLPIRKKLKPDSVPTLFLPPALPPGRRVTRSLAKSDPGLLDKKKVVKMTKERLRARPGRRTSADKLRSVFLTKQMREKSSKDVKGMRKESDDTGQEPGRDPLALDESPIAFCRLCFNYYNCEDLNHERLEVKITNAKLKYFVFKEMRGTYIARQYPNLLEPFENGEDHAFCRTCYGKLEAFYKLHEKLAEVQNDLAKLKDELLQQFLEAYQKNKTQQHGFVNNDVAVSSNPVCIGIAAETNGRVPVNPLEPEEVEVVTILSDDDDNAMVKPEDSVDTDEFEEGTDADPLSQCQTESKVPEVFEELRLSPPKNANVTVLWVAEKESAGAGCSDLKEEVLELELASCNLVIERLAPAPTPKINRRGRPNLLIKNRQPKVNLSRTKKYQTQNSSSSSQSQPKLKLNEQPEVNPRDLGTLSWVADFEIKDILETPPLVEAIDQDHPKIRQRPNILRKSRQVKYAASPSQALPLDDQKSSQPLAKVKIKKPTTEDERRRQRILRFQRDVARGPYTCEICFQVFRRSNNLRAHKPIHSDKTKKCPICEKFFHKTTNLKQHLVTHSSEKNHCCDICGKTYLFRYQLSEHKLKIHKIQKKFVCTNLTCPENNPEFATWKEFLKHRIEIHNYSPKLQTNSETADVSNNQCDICGRMYSTAKSLRSHVEIVHRCVVNLNPAQRFICEQCGKQCSTKANLNLHISRHTGVPAYPIKCKYCEQKFKRVVAKRKHMLNKHKEDYVPEGCCPCEICYLVFENEAQLVEHRAHAKCGTYTANHAYPNKCKYCEQRFRSTISKRKHMTIDHKEMYAPEGSYICKKCYLVFVSEALLSEHDAKSHPNLKMQCQVCGKVFSTAQRLKLHLVIHTNEKAFECKFCGKCFGRADNLKGHEDRHAKLVEPHNCDLCDKQFLRKKDMEEHLQSKHSG